MRRSTIRILISDDHKLLRDGLAVLLQRQPDFELVGEAGDGRSTIALCGEVHPDVVLMDIAMPDLNGIEATRGICAVCPEARVLMLSMHADPRFVYESLKAGAWGYLLKDSAAEELVVAIRSVVGGRRYFSAAISDLVIRDYLDLKRDDRSPAYASLSGREREVLQLLAEGLSTKEIASRCHVSAKTVETHRQHIMEKVGVKSIAELTKYAIREGLTPLG